MNIHFLEQGCGSILKGRSHRKRLRLKEEEILAAASKLFVSKGYHETSVEDIANAVGITKGGLYYYVESKEDVLYEIHQRFISEGLKRLRAVLENSSDPLIQLLHLIRAHISIIHDYKNDIQVFFEGMRQLSKDKQESIRLKRDEYEQIFLETIQRGIEQGYFKSVNPKVVVLYLMGALNWMYTWYKPEKSYPESIIQLFCELTINGLTVRSNDRYLNSEIES